MRSSSIGRVGNFFGVTWLGKIVSSVPAIGALLHPTIVNTPRLIHRFMLHHLRSRNSVWCF